MKLILKTEETWIANNKIETLSLPFADILRNLANNVTLKAQGTFKLYNENGRVIMEINFD